MVHARAQRCDAASSCRVVTIAVVCSSLNPVWWNVHVLTGLVHNATHELGHLRTVARSVDSVTIVAGKFLLSLPLSVAVCSFRVQAAGGARAHATKVPAAVP